MFLNADVPVFFCKMRKEYLYDLQSHHGEFIDVAVFGVASIPARAIMFHALTENGAQIARMPISAFVHKKEAPNIPLDHLELWNSFSYEVSVQEFDFLKGIRCRTILKDQKIYEGEYMFTLDWCGNPDSENPGEGGHKNAHIIKLDNGCFAAQPNNRIFWLDPSFIVEPFKERPDYVTNSHIWKCEDGTKWVTEASDKYFYNTNKAN
jgi:hypothetical protein